jgi:Icc-related predicted phosphoesterase
MKDPLATPNRIAFAGDWHANIHWALSAIKYAAEQGADVIVHLGDFGYRYNAEFLRRVSKELAYRGLHILFVDGNHEDFPILLRYRVHENGLRKLTNQIYHLPRGFRWQWDGITFLALGGAYSVDRKWRVPGTSWWKEEELTPEDVQHAIDGGPVDIFVSHDCPTGVPIPDLNDDAFPFIELVRAEEHRTLVRQVVDEVCPRRIFHGHYHRDYQVTVDLGYGPVVVTGLDCDGLALARNVQVVDLAELKESE